jgi:hypothetical protein
MGAYCLIVLKKRNFFVTSKITYLSHCSNRRRAGSPRLDSRKEQEFSFRDRTRIFFPTKRGHAGTGSGATLRLPAARSNYTDHDLLQQLSLPGRHTYCGHSGSPVGLQMCVTKKPDYKVNVWGWDHATCSLNGPKWSIIVNRQAVETMRQNVCLILEISWNARNDTPISTFCPPLSTHCLFVQGDMEVKELVVTDKNKQNHKPLNPLRCVYCPKVPQTVCLLDKRCPFMVCKINTGLQCKCSCMYKHLLSLHQQIRYNIRSWVPFIGAWSICYVSLLMIDLFKLLIFQILSFLRTFLGFQGGYRPERRSDNRV